MSIGSIVFWIAAAGLVWLAYLAARFILFPKPHEAFWKAVGRNPDLALHFFSAERSCSLTDTRPSSEHSGPFTVNSSHGAVKVYIRFADIEDVQARVGAKLAEYQAKHT